MFFRILFNDLKKKKTMNAILFVFVILVSTFMAAGVNNLYTTMSALNYYEDYSNIGDAFAFLNNVDDEAEMDAYVDGISSIKDFEKQEYLYMDSSKITMNGNKEFEMHNPMLIRNDFRYSRIFDADAKEFTLKSGEVAVPYKESVSNDISPGDFININVKDNVYKMKVACITKDYFCGSDMMGISRIVISDEDYADILARNPSARFLCYMISSDHPEEFVDGLSSEDIQVMMVFDKSIIKASYFLVMVAAAVIMVLSIAIILIVILALRFSLVFTIENDYKQIGIMKAIGLKSRKIRRIYMVKYYAIAISGAFIGLILSYPVGLILLYSVRQALVVESGGISAAWINALSAIVTVAIVVISGYICTGRLKKFSAIESIRNGSTGERYKAKQKLHLFNKKKMGAVLYMSLNDILSNIRRYIVLILTFAVGMMLVITPLNLITTMQDVGMLRSIGLQVCDFYAGLPNDILQLESEEDVEKILTGYEDKVSNSVDVTLSIDLMYSGTVYLNDRDKGISISTLSKNIVDNADVYEYYKGTSPLLENEAAITKKTADKIGAVIGDTITVVYGDVERKYIITGYYQSMSNLGEGVRVSKNADVPFSCLTGFTNSYGKINDSSTYEEVKNAFKVCPGIEIMTCEETLEAGMGSSMAVVNSLSVIIFPIVILMNAFITILLVKSFLIKERKEIAMLKCLGYSNKSIKKWQMLRIAISSLIGAGIGILLSKLFDYVSALIFKGLGLERFSLEVNPMVSYVAIPLCFIVINAIMSYLGMGAVKRTESIEVNSQE